MKNPVNVFGAAIFAGLLIVVQTIVMAFYYPATLDTLPAGFVTPILAIEFCNSLQSAQLIFADNQALIQQTQTGHRLDMLFLVIYGSFLVLTHWGFWKLAHHALSIPGAISALIAASADLAENLNLLQLGEALLGLSAPPDFWWLRLFVATKFIGISVSMLCLIPALWPRGKLGKAFAIATVALLPCTALALLDMPAMVEAMTLLIVIGWMCLLAWLVRNGRRELSTGNAVQVAFTD